MMGYYFSKLFYLFEVYYTTRHTYLFVRLTCPPNMRTAQRIGIKNEPNRFSKQDFYIFKHI